MERFPCMNFVERLWQELFPTLMRQAPRFAGSGFLLRRWIQCRHRLLHRRKWQGDGKWCRERTAADLVAVFCIARLGCKQAIGGGCDAGGRAQLEHEPAAWPRRAVRQETGHEEHLPEGTRFIDRASRRVSLDNKIERDIQQNDTPIMGRGVTNCGSACTLGGFSHGSPTGKPDDSNSAISYTK